MKERREPFRDRTLHILDPRLFPTRESVIDFLRSDHFVALTHAIERAVTCDFRVPEKLADKMRLAASYAIDDVALLVSDAVGSKRLVFDRDQNSWEEHPPQNRTEYLCNLAAAVAAENLLTLGPEFMEFCQKHIDSIQRRELPAEEDEEVPESEEPSGATESPPPESAQQEPRFEVARILRERVNERIFLTTVLSHPDSVYPDRAVDAVVCDTVKLVQALAEYLETGTMPEFKSHLADAEFAGRCLLRVERKNDPLGSVELLAKELSGEWDSSKPSAEGPSA